MSSCWEGMWYQGQCSAGQNCCIRTYTDESGSDTLNQDWYCAYESECPDSQLSGTFQYSNAVDGQCVLSYQVGQRSTSSLLFPRFSFVKVHPGSLSEPGLDRCCSFLCLKAPATNVDCSQYFCYCVYSQTQSDQTITTQTCMQENACLDTYQGVCFHDLQVLTEG